jgi:glycerol dehydrogenase
MPRCCKWTSLFIMRHKHVSKNENRATSPLPGNTGFGCGFYQEGGIMNRTFVSAGRYIQGKGIIEKCGIYMKPWGSHPIVVGGSTGISVVIHQLRDSLQKEDLELYDIFSKAHACTEKIIHQAQEKVKETEADFIIGVGGGSAVDVAKAAAFQLQLPVVTIPTVPSTNADMSAVSVIYNDEGKFKTKIRSHQNPCLVVVDTGILASAPPSFLASGMGDALSSRFEIEACYQSGSKNHVGGHVMDFLVHTGRLCYNTLMKKGESAFSHVKKNKVTHTVESVIEAIKFQSAIGFESGGNAAAHAIHNGFTRASHVKGSHGEIVAFSVIAQLFLEDKPLYLIERVAKWCHALGLPTTLTELSVDEDCIKAVSEASCYPESSIHHEPFPVSPSDVARSITHVHELGCCIAESEA